LKVGIVNDQFSGFADYDSYIKEDFAALLKKIADSDVELEKVKNIDFINDIHAMHDQIYCKSLSYYFQEEFVHTSKMSKIMSEMIAMGHKIDVADFINAMRRQPEYRAKFDPIIKSYDFLLTPSTASVAPKVGQSERPDTCLIWTFLGYPVLSLPVFWSEEMNLPFGLQLVAPKYGDFSLFDFGEAVIKKIA
jgi:Asp-tRNA(Asn)/Glu-tRNA(Gln) amidotransferase A subunit family amidase